MKLLYSVTTTEKSFTFARYAQMWFNKTDDMDRKRAIFAALGSHLIIKDQNLNVTLHPYFKTIFEKRDKVEKEIMQVRTSKIEQNTREFAKTMAKCPTLRRGWDLNPRARLRRRRLATCRFKPLSHLSRCLHFILKSTFSQFAK